MKIIPFHPPRFTLHPSRFTLHPSRFTLYPSPFTFYFLPFTFYLFSFLLIPSALTAGVINTKTELSCAVDRKNDIAVQAKIANKGNSTAYRITLSLFIEDWAQKFDNLGDNLPDGMIKFNETVSIPDLKPGMHILVARVSFEEQSGTSHRIYEYFPFSYKMEKTNKESELSLELKPPLFNLRAFMEAKKKMVISMNNSSNNPLSPVISFFLSDGYTAGDASIQATVPPNTKIEEIVVIEKEKSINQEGKILAVAWYEKNGIIYSVKSEGTTGVVEKPVLFKWYVLFCVIILIAVTILIILRRKAIKT